MTTQPDWVNKLHFGDNLPIMREQIPDESVDLIYLDPPFNSNATYNVLFREHDSSESAAQIQAFDDTWTWSIEAERQYEEVVTSGPTRLANLVQAMRQFLGQSDMMAYLTMMAPRMVELHRVLKSTGSIYLHCDPTASHYLKLLMDAVFGPQNYRNEITWRRTTSHNDARRNFSAVADIILTYAKSPDFTFNRVYVPYSQEYLDGFYRYVDENGRRYRLNNMRSPAPRPNLTYDYKGYKPHPNGWTVSIERMRQLDAEGRLHFPESKDGRLSSKLYLDEMPGVPVGNVWDDINPISAHARERLGYPTQKPEALLERIISASSNEGDIVLDPFCGCGTAIAVAERLNRKWIGIDVTHLAISLMRNRLRDTFGDEVSHYEVIGSPQDVESARALSLEGGNTGRYQFEYWALGLVEARPGHDRKKGADAGVDGIIRFFDDNSGKAKTIIVQVKSGHVNRGIIATLRGDMEREKAEMALLVTLEHPTRPMEQDAAAAGFYTPEIFPDNRFPRVQIATIADILDGNGPQIPRLGGSQPSTFRHAPRRRTREGRSERML